MKTTNKKITMIITNKQKMMSALWLAALEEDSSMKKLMVINPKISKSTRQLVSRKKMRKIKTQSKKNKSNSMKKNFQYRKEKD